MTRAATHERRARVVLRLTTVASLLLVSTAIFTPSQANASGASSGTGAVTKSRSVNRTFLDDRTTTTVDSRKVTLKVAQTNNLRSLQLIHVSWSGAHPTGGLVPDTNSDLAQNEEYPFALFECRGDDSAKHPLDPDTCWTQYGDERFSGGFSDPPWPAWRGDARAPAAQRRPIVDAPGGVLPAACRDSMSGMTTERWVPFVAAGKHTYPGGYKGCAGQPPEASPQNYAGNLSLPSNETFGVTDAKGNGATDFDVFTGEDHASLGCSQTVTCSLVAVPIEGLSCDPSGANLPEADRPDADGAAASKRTCETKGKFTSGQILSSGQAPDVAVSGQYWWSPSNWKQRISVPLSFAPSDDACALKSSGREEDVYGSELMIQATTSWQPHFCLDKSLFNFNHVQTPEPQARSLIGNGNISAAFTSEPPDTPYARPTVNAPTAVTGFGISFDVDDGSHAPLRHLKLDTRLLAKLLTESYPDTTEVRDNDSPLANNPLNVSYDPEFQALNPGVPERYLDSAATLLTLNSDSDVMTALTSYINADPQARSWLNGKADPWGMVVNPNYKKIALPVNNWPLLDSFELPKDYTFNQVPCLFAAPTPYLPLVAAPTSRLFSIGQDMQFGLVQSQTQCVQPAQAQGNYTGDKMVAVGRQGPGSRVILGVVSLGDAAREGLTLASLQTHTPDSAAARFTSAAGRTFVAPDTSSLRAAARALVKQPSTQTYALPYGTIRTRGDDAGAYPGTMVVNTQVPTTGLNRTDAANYGKFLDFVAGAGQHPGTAQGDLPAGYLSMSSANGLGGLAGYTRCAAKAVTAQRGTVPSVSRACPNPSSGFRGDLKDRAAANGSGSGGAGGTATAGGATAAAGTPAQQQKASAARAAANSTSSPTTLNARRASASTPSYGSTLSGLVLPILFVLALVGFAAALGMRVLAARGRTGAP